MKYVIKLNYYWYKVSMMQFNKWNNYEKYNIYNVNNHEKYNTYNANIK